MSVACCVVKVEKIFGFRCFCYRIISTHKNHSAAEEYLNEKRRANPNGLYLVKYDDELIAITHNGDEKLYSDSPCRCKK
jgi:hypothetical protein